MGDVDLNPVYTELSQRPAIHEVAETGTLLVKVDSLGRLYEEKTVDEVLDGASGSTGGGLHWVKTAELNIVTQVGYGYLIDVSVGPPTVILPSSPNEGDAVGICDAYNAASTNNITLDRNGNNIKGLSENYIISIDGDGFTLVYVDASRGWEIVSKVKATSSTGDITGELFESSAYILTSTDISNKFVTLPYTPQDTNEIIFDIKGAPNQYYGDDFKQDETFGKRITWEGLSLDGVLQEDDKIVISYTRSS